MVPRGVRNHSAPGVFLFGGRSGMLVIIAVICVASNYGGTAEAALRKLHYGKPRGPSSAIACEEKKLILECQRGEVIRILRANYGRFTISVCNQHGQTDGLNLQCRSPKSKDIISERCDGRQKCEMLVNNHVFGDPCPSTSKYAEVKYNCQKAPSDTQSRMNATTATSNIRPDPAGPRRTNTLVPKPPHITHAKALSPTDIELTWTHLKTESPIITFVVYYVDKGMSEDPMTFYTSSNSPVILSDLRPDAEFEIYVKIFNNYGPSAASNLVRVKTPPAVTLSKSSRTSSPLSRWMTPNPDLKHSSAYSASKTSGSEHVMTSTNSYGIGTKRMNLTMPATSQKRTRQYLNNRGFPNTAGNDSKTTQGSVGSKQSFHVSKAPTATEPSSMSIYIKVRGSQKPNGQRVKAPGLTENIPTSSESSNSPDLKGNSRVLSNDEHREWKNENRPRESIQSNLYATSSILPPYYNSPIKENNSIYNTDKKDSRIENRTNLSPSNHTNYNSSNNNNITEYNHSSSNLPIKNDKKSHSETEENEPKLGRLKAKYHIGKSSDSNLIVSSSIIADERTGSDSDPQTPSMGRPKPTTTTTTTTTTPTTTTTTTTTETSQPITPSLPPDIDDATTPLPPATKNEKPDSATTARLVPPDNKNEGKDNTETNPSRGGRKRRRRFCEETEVDGIFWPRTRYGKIAENDCPRHLIGVSSWVCLQYGWEKNGPDISHCTSRWLLPLSQQIQDVLEGKEDAEEAVVMLKNMMEAKNMSAGDLRQTATKLLPKLRLGMMRDKHHESKLQRKRRLKKFKKAFMKTSSFLLSRKQAKAWRRLPRRECLKAATSVMLAVENTGYQTAAMMDVGSSDVTIDDNIIMEVNVLGQQQIKEDVRFPSQSDLSNSNWGDLKDSIVIPSLDLKLASETGPVNLVFTIYKNMEELIQPESDSMTLASSSSDNYNDANTIIDSDDTEATTVHSKIIVNTNIIAASINSTKFHWTLPEPIRFTLHHLQETKGASPMCSYWDINEKLLSGSWSQKGCRVIESNSTHTTCECDHLTNFAVLMDVSGQEMSEDHELALRVITYVGCVVSIFCLMLSWITFIVFKNLQCDRNTIHKNLVLCLMVAEIIFVAGIVQTQPKLLCSIIAGLLHYFFLGAFAWMCLEGVQLYVMLIEVFELEKSRVTWYYLFGYGVPLAIVAVSAGVKYEGYGTDKHCWLSNDNYFIWSFIGPALTVIMINLGMLSLAICTMCRHSNVSATMKERSRVAKFNVSDTYSSMETFAPAKLRFPELPAWVKGAVVLVVLLGLTWILGVFYLNQESLVMAYAFTIFNSLQGLFIFVFHCLMNEKVQKEYRKVARRTSWLPNCVRVNYGGYAGVSSSPNASSGSGNYFSRLFGTRRRKQSATSTHSSMKPFLNKDQHRRSDTIENSSSRDSSTIPSSLNGYIYTPHHNGNNNYPMVIPYNNNIGLHKPGFNNHGHLEPCYETVGEGIVGDLSEVIDCSMVDSEMVSEYCKNGFQVCHEHRRYSTGSENSGYEVPREVMNVQLPPQNEVPSQNDIDRLSTLSCASSSKKPASSFVSTSDMGTRSDLDASGAGHEEDEDEQSLDLHLERYIIPTKRNDEFGHDQYDQKSSSMNKLTRPSIPLTGAVPEREIPSSPHHSSSPNIEFRLGFSPPSPSQPPIIHPEHTDQREMASSPSDASNPSSAKSSLPNLPIQVNGDVSQSTEGNPQQRITPKARPSSDADIPFSPFRFSKSDC